MTFGWASDDPSLRQLPTSILEERVEALGLQTQYYTPAVHAASFALPAYIQALIAESS